MAELVSAVIQLIVLSTPMGIYLAVHRRRADRGRPAMGLTSGNAGDYAWAMAAFLIMLAISAASSRLIPTDVLVGAGTTNRVTSVVVAIAVVIRAVAEEVLFRGFLQGVAAIRFGRVVGILVQAVLFLLPHLALLALSPLLWPILPAQLCSGLALGWLRSRHDSIGPAVAVHAATNLTAGLLI